MNITQNKLATLAVLTLSSLLAFSSAARAQTTNPPPATATSRPPQGPRAKFGPLPIMKQSLNLTDEQVHNLEPVMKEQQAKVAALRSDSTLSRQERVAKLKESGEAANTKLKAVLTPEQSEKWQKMRSSQQNGAQQWPAMRINQGQQSSPQTNSPTKQLGPASRAQGSGPH